MMRRFACVAAIVASAAAPSGQDRGAKTLNIYVVDVEGGNATLVVSPTGESLLIDTGNAGAGAVRDANRILEATRDAGLSKIDHLIITHWHGDHYGGLAELAARIPISHFIDHGPNVQPSQVVDDFLRTTSRRSVTHSLSRASRCESSRRRAMCSHLRSVARAPRIPTAQISKPATTTLRIRNRSAASSPSAASARSISAT